VIATDNGVPETRNATTTLLLFVIAPDNFFSPVLDEPNYNVDVDENSESGQVVLNFSITDGDQAGAAAELRRVIISGNDAQFFEAVITGSMTGSIRTK